MVLEKTKKRAIHFPQRKFAVKVRSASIGHFPISLASFGPLAEASESKMLTDSYRRRLECWIRT
jgi:hypothetical protein